MSFRGRGRGYDRGGRGGFNKFNRYEEGPPAALEGKLYHNTNSLH